MKESSDSRDSSHKIHDENFLDRTSAWSLGINTGCSQYGMSYMHLILNYSLSIQHFDAINEARQITKMHLQYKKWP